MSLLQSLPLVDRNKLLVRRLYEDCINTGRLDLLKELLAEDFAASPGGVGPEAYASTVRGLLIGFPDVRFVIEDLFAEGERVAVRWRFEATHSGPFAGVSATGRRVTQTGNVIYHARDGKLARAWVQVDRLGLLQQISPPPVHVPA